MNQENKNLALIISLEEKINSILEKTQNKTYRAELTAIQIALNKAKEEEMQEAKKSGAIAEAENVAARVFEDVGNAINDLLKTIRDKETKLSLHEVNVTAGFSTSALQQVSLFANKENKLIEELVNMKEQIYQIEPLEEETKSDKARFNF